MVREVRDRKGKVLYESQPEKKRAVKEDIAHDVTFALSNVVEEGTGSAVQSLNRPVAGKTGTKDRKNADGSSDIVSAWFVAYTRQISTAVMYVAGNDGTGDLDKYARPGDSTFFGGTYPALTWADYMKTATKGQAIKQFPDPAYVNREEVPQPDQTMQESLQPTDQPPTEDPSSTPTETWTWPTEWPVPSNPGATKTKKPGGGNQVPPRWRRLVPSDSPTGGQVEQSPTVGIEARSPSIFPSATDSFVGTVSQRIGGPLGRYAAVGWAWWNPLRVTLLVGTLVYLSGVVFRLPCRITTAGQPPPDHFKYLCYSDIGLLYAGRGLMQGNTPYLDDGGYPVLEYPVLTGWFLELERLITRALGGLQGADLTEQQRVDSTLIFIDVNTVLLGALFLVALWALVRTPAGRPWDAMMLAASPCVAAAALINWDMLPVALTALAMACWARRRPGLAGVMLGLGAAAKLYPRCCWGRSSCSACEPNGWATS